MIIFKDPKTMKQENLDINWFRLPADVPLDEKDLKAVEEHLFYGNLPFDILGIEDQGFLFVLENIDDTKMLLSSIKHNNLFTEILYINKKFDKKTISLEPVSVPLDKNILSSFFRIVARFLKALEVGTTQVYKPVGHKSNPKRIKKGKKPIYEWKLVDIKPKAAERPSLGGTHASPRQHDRRGHWRVIKKTGNKVWVKPCVVGSINNGRIDHVYRLA